MDLNEGTGSSARDVQQLRHNYEQMRAVFTLSETTGRAASLADIYAAALASLQDALGVKRAAVLLFDPAGIMRFKAWVGLSDSYRISVEGHTPWSSSEPNPQPVLLADVTADPALQVLLPQSGELLCDVIRREGIGALAMVPLVDQSGLLGKFMVYYATPHDFDVDEVRFMLTLASTIAFAITRKRAEDALRESEQRYRLFVQNFTGIAYQLEQGHILPRLMEGASVDICGYPADVFLRGDVCWPDAYRRARPRPYPAARPLALCHAGCHIGRRVPGCAQIRRNPLGARHCPPCRRRGDGAQLYSGRHVRHDRP